MLGRVIAAVVVVTVAVGATASAQDVKLPGIDFGRYHALVIGNNDYEQLPKGRITDIGMQWRRT